MREAIIILPKKDNAKKSLRNEHASLQRDLVDSFGGFSSHESNGAWRDDSTGQIYRDVSTVYTIAANWNEAVPNYPLITKAEKLESIARDYAAKCRQVCLYVRHGNGEIVFATPAIAKTNQA